MWFAFHRRHGQKRRLRITVNENDPLAEREARVWNVNRDVYRWKAYWKEDMFNQSNHKMLSYALKFESDTKTSIREISVKTYALDVKYHNLFQLSRMACLAALHESVPLSCCEWLWAHHLKQQKHLGVRYKWHEEYHEPTTILFKSFFSSSEKS